MVVAPSSENHEDESDDENEVVVFEHEGIKYYKDAEDQLYLGDIENAELIGWWNAETKTIEEFDDDGDEKGKGDRGMVVFGSVLRFGL